MPKTKKGAKAPFLRLQFPRGHFEAAVLNPINQLNGLGRALASASKKTCCNSDSVNVACPNCCCSS